MKYIPVTGLNPVGDVKNIIINTFNAALISIAEPTTSKSWTIHQVFRQMDKIFKAFGDVEELYLDSGGYQILVGYIQKRRLREYIDTYHILLEKFHDRNMKIFSLDILNKKYSKEEVIKLNDYSINESLKLLNKYSELKEKQLFIVQSRFPEVLETWKELMNKHPIFETYKRYSFGGLVGLKKETNAKFNHFVPMTMWLLSFAKSKNSLNNIKHIHMLGQSSRIAILTAIAMEKFLASKGINLEITMDSSEILRFSPIEQKLPLIFKNNNNFQMARSKDDLKIMIENNVHLKNENYDLEKALELIEEGKVENSDFVEIICQGIDSTMEFAEWFFTKYYEELISGDMFNWSVEDFKEKHPIFNQGRLAQELINNLKFIQIGYSKIDDFKDIHNYTKSIIQNYYV